MTQLSVSPVGRAARHLPVVVPARTSRHGGLGATVTPRPAWLVGPVRDAAASLIGAAAALVGLIVIGHDIGVWLAGAVVLCWPVLLASQGCFVDRPLGEPPHARASRVLRAGCALGLLSWVSALFLGEAAAPSVMLPATAAVTVAGLAGIALGRARSGGARVLLVGHADDLKPVATELACSSDSVVVGGCVPGRHLPDSDFPVHTGVESAVAHASRAGADTLVVTPGPDIPPALVRRLQWQASAFGMATYVSTGLLDVASFRVSLATGPGPNLLHVRPSPSRGLRRFVKQVCERAIAVLALLVFAPVLAAVAVMVRLDSAGPAMFRQVRVGQNGQLFTMYKFRTMSCAAETERDRLAGLNEGAGVLFKLRTDPRVTKLGGVLRRYSLDELPQLWNVVTGDMALVGPRPALPEEVAKYDLDPRRRLAVKPGLTGLWQVSGRSDLDWEQTVRLDLRYVDNWSLRLDASILCRTVRAVLDHRGAY